MTFHAVLLNNESKMNCSSMSSETCAICFLSNAVTYQWRIWFISDWWPLMLINRLVLLLLSLTHALCLCSSFICLMGGSSNASHSCFLCLPPRKAKVCDSSDHSFESWSYFFLHCTFWLRLLPCWCKSTGFASSPSVCSPLLNRIRFSTHGIPSFTDQGVISCSFPQLFGVVFFVSVKNHHF